MVKAASGGGTDVTATEEVTYLESKDLLLGIAITEEDFEIDGVGIVRLRGLTAKQGVEGLRGMDKDPMMRFQKIILMGVVRPQMTDADLALLADGKIGVVQNLATKIMEMSGMTLSEDEANEAVEGFLEKAQSENSSSSTASKNSTDSPAN